MSGDSHARLELTTERIADVMVVRVEGEVDLASAEQLAGVLRTAAGGAENLVVDLVGVPFMDSSGLKVLLMASQQLGDRLALVLQPGSPIAHLLTIAEVADRFSIHPTAEAAVGSRGGP